jgi:hypothetical protein
MGQREPACSTPLLSLRCQIPDVYLVDWTPRKSIRAFLYLDLGSAKHNVCTNSFVDILREDREEGTHR